MRPLTRNERLLAIALGSILFLFANLAGMRWVADQMRSARGTITQLETETAELRKVLAERPYWVARQQWIAENPPSAYDDATSRARFVEEIQAGVRAQGLKILSQQPLETDRAGSLAITSMDLVIDGRLEAIVRWLHAGQQPGKYLFAQTFTLKQGEDGNSMQLQIRLGKIHRVGGLTAVP